MGDMGDTFRHPHMKRFANLFNSVNLVSGKSLLQTVSTLPVAEPVKPTPMKLRIFADIAASEEAMELLKNEVSDHELLLPENRTTSVLAQAEPDPQMLTADVIFGQPHPDFVSRAESLRWIQISSAGFTRYDTPEFRELVRGRNILVSNSSSVYDEACAVHTLSFMLAQARNLPESVGARMPHGTESWNRLRYDVGLLRGESAVIVGYGAIGQYLVKLLVPFEMRLTGYRRKERGDEEIPIIGLDQLDEVLSDADHIINTLPDSPQTRHFFNEERLNSTRKGAIFYNVGRGTTVDQDALQHALESGQLGAAWLDVTDPEPLPDGHPLLDIPNCFITPHTAGGHRGEDLTLVSHFLNNLKRFTGDRELQNRIM